ncbi:MAG TPA: NADH-quinone oxidoreductase subunit NuoF [Herpetosiphonaceae bacterium]|nr:NADH-quinone oxidoreductase subunit NuoF [Herpetosiphonaceae bacterium]
MPKTELKEYIVLRNREIENIRDLDVYVANGGYETARRALTTMTPQAVVDEVKKSGLRGRGGAGFPTGVKWGFVPKELNPKYLVVNADESEPGTFNNHEIIDLNPHQLIEGIVISAFAIGANTAYIYIRGEFAYGARFLDEKIAEARARGFVGANVFGSGFNIDIHVHRGAGAYICGEETALLESLEGKIGQPRLKPPFPAVAGLYAKPTVVNNVETLANVPRIVEKGADWFRSFGTEKSPGTKAVSISGHVKNAGNYEIPLGITMREFIFDWAGGMRSDVPLKFIVPGGASSAWLTAEHLDTPMTWDDMAAAGTMLGSGAMVVLDESVPVVKAALKIDEFFKHESCGKCSPCREGTHFLVKVWERIDEGHGRAGDIELLADVGKQMLGKCFCPLGDSAVSAVNSAIKFFRPEIEADISHSK